MASSVSEADLLKYSHFVRFSSLYGLLRYPLPTFTITRNRPGFLCSPNLFLLYLCPLVIGVVLSISAANSLIADLCSASDYINPNRI
jgi:hypothetical protein